MGKDITLERINTQKLATTIKELADFKFALDQSSIVATTDHNGRITYVNDKFCEISKYSKNELIGNDHHIFNSGYHSKAIFLEICGKRFEKGMFGWVKLKIKRKMVLFIG